MHTEHTLFMKSAN